jgi:glycine cleavage system transcriptional repressor
MKKIVLSVLGYDRPGIVALVSKTLFEQQCNIEDVSQTILQTEFAGVFIASMPEQASEADLLARLRECLEPMGLSVLLKPLEAPGEWKSPPSEPFIITTTGLDRPGLVAGITEVMALFGVNITNLRAAFRGGPDPGRNTMIYEADVPNHIDQAAFRSTLRERARELGLDINVQHRSIFEVVHRV